MAKPHNRNPEPPVRLYNSGRPARDWAAELVDAWINKRDSSSIRERIPEWQRPLAEEMARSSCEIIQIWFRRVRSGMPVYQVPKALRPPVEEMISVRR